MSTTRKIAYAPAEVATLLGIARSTVYAGVESKRIPHHKLGDRILIPSEWVERFGTEPYDLEAEDSK